MSKPVDSFLVDEVAVMGAAADDLDSLKGEKSEVVHRLVAERKRQIVTSCLVIIEHLVCGRWEQGVPLCK